MTAADPPQQVAERIITDPEAASALMNVTFLGQFREPASPSDVARTLAMPANLAHHHAQKCLRLGLLFKAGREKGKVLYQLSALTFKIKREIGEANHLRESVFDRNVQQLTASFLEATERSYQRLRDDDERWSICTFAKADHAPPAPPNPTNSDESHPALFVQRTFKLTPERYKQLLSRINRLIQEAQTERSEVSAKTCTIAALGFEGVAHEGLTDDSLSYSTFFTPVPEDQA